MGDGSNPRFLQGAFTFDGKGYDSPALLDSSLRYVVPAGMITFSGCRQPELSGMSSSTRVRNT